MRMKNDTRKLEYKNNVIKYKYEENLKKKKAYMLCDTNVFNTHARVVISSCTKKKYKIIHT